MSWQDYVDNQLLASACVSRAAIAGHDGGVWAKSNGFEVSSPYLPVVHQTPTSSFHQQIVGFANSSRHNHSHPNREIWMCVGVGGEMYMIVCVYIYIYLPYLHFRRLQQREEDCETPLNLQRVRDCRIVYKC